MHTKGVSARVGHGPVDHFESMYLINTSIFEQWGQLNNYFSGVFSRFKYPAKKAAERNSS